MLPQEQQVEIRKKRKKARITQLELANKTSIDRSRLSQAECGYIKLRPEELDSIARAISAEVKRRAASLSLGE
jgi:transcriptional regulator with XRE-family HTH domain